MKPAKDLHRMLRKAKPLDHWSYSAWAAAQTCAYKFLGQYILGIKETTVGPALIRGTELHKKAEGYLKGEVTSLPRKDFRVHHRHYKMLRRYDPIVEQFWGVSNTWEPTKWKSWVVMKMDAAVEPHKDFNRRLIIQDLKSGREYPDHQKQADIYAPIGLAMYPKAKGVEVEFWYADLGYSTRYEYTLKQLSQLKDFWIEEGTELLKPKKRYLPTPSEDNCRWCFLRSDKGGDCTAWQTISSLRGAARR